MTTSREMARLLVLSLLFSLLLIGCGTEVSGEPRDLLLAPDDFPNGSLSVVSLSEEQSLDGPSAQVELQGSDYRVVQSLILYESRELSLGALDGIRSDLVSQGQSAPRQVEASGIFEHRLGDEDALSMFFIEDRGLVRLTVTGDARQELLTSLADVAREKLKGG